MDESSFLAEITDTLANLPGVAAVTLGGSRAQGTHRPDSDWDFAVCYRDGFDPADLRAVGWPGEISAIGGWGGGVLNGGAWLTVDGRAVDVHYRDLNVVEREVARADRGEFDIEPLMFHLAGIPTYLVVGELAIARVLAGDLPRPAYPAALRTTAPRVWADRAEATLAYAERSFAGKVQVVESAGAIAVAAMCYAHAILAARGEWTTNEKTLLDRAGLRDVDTDIDSLADDPGAVIRAVRDRALGILREVDGQA